jgi:hypothetical protein
MRNNPNELNLTSQKIAALISGAAPQQPKIMRCELPGGGCFAAGTLVHTKEGLVPIEEIKVGDWVLSQPEETGERVYKRVVKTVTFEDKPVWQITYCPKDNWDRGGPNLIGTYKRIVVTANHPFWIEGKGWSDLFQIEHSDHLKFADGRIGVIYQVLPLYLSATNGVAWVPSMADPGEGELIDLRNGAGEFISNQLVNILDDVEMEDDPSSLFRTKVFNLEVEDCHSYYVGTQGVWVHNSDCAELNDLLINATCIK